MAGPRDDTRGILDAAELFRRVDFRRHEPAPALRPYIEHYWLIDWELPEPFEQHVVPHPSVNIVFQRHPDDRLTGEVAGVGLELFSIKLEGRGQVSGVQFRPGGFHPFARRSVSDFTNRRVPIESVFEPGDLNRFFGARSSRIAALDGFLTGLQPAPDPLAQQAMTLVDLVRHDRTIGKVADFARRADLSPRRLQRLFADHVGVSPKWVILRYRIHEAIERAGTEVDWATLAAELGYSDQAHLTRDFTATIGLSPSAYRRMLSGN